jgi:hypothetical protein
MTEMIHDIAEIAYEQIHNEYYRARYGDFTVIMNINTRYINATHLCALATTKNGKPKHFPVWRTNNSAKELINEVALVVGVSPADLLAVPVNVPNDIRGTYVHPDLIPHIAYWASVKFAVAVMKIVNRFMIDRELNRRSMTVVSGGHPEAEIAARVSMRDEITNASLPIDRVLKCVYFIRSGEYTKIGYTADLPKSMSALQTANPERLELVHTILTIYAEKVESDLHQIFAEYNVGGEWFRLPDDAIAQVKVMYDD